MTARTTTPRPTTHKQKLLQQGMQQFYERGYNGTSVDGVLEAAQVPKGSFYHYFGSKESFGLAVLEVYTAWQLRLVDKWSNRDDLSTPDILTGYYDELATGFIESEFARGCIAGKFSGELANSSVTLRNETAAAFARWRQALADLLVRGQQRGDIIGDVEADELAGNVLALIQGAFLVALSTRDPKFMSDVSSSLKRMISTT